MTHQNPFDRIAPAVGVIRIIVGPTAIGALSNEELRHLVRIADLAVAEMVFVPGSAESRQILIDSGSRLATIEPHDKFFVLRGDHWNALLGGRRLVEGHALTVPSAWMDLLLALCARRFDLVVASEESIRELPASVDPQRVCAVPELLRRLRLFAIANRCFEVEPGFQTDEWLYYHYRLRVTFPAVQAAWSTIIHQLSQPLAKALEDRVASLQKRLGFMTRASDEVCIEGLRSPHVNVEERCLYSLGYLTMLSTGALEDIAWIVQRFFDLKLGRMETTFRLPLNGRSRMLKALQAASPELATFLASPAVAGAVRGLYSIRDQLQHRTFPQPVAVLARQRRELGRVVLSASAVEPIATLVGRTIEARAHGRGADEQLVDPYALALGIMDLVRHLTSSVISRLPWDRLSEQAYGEEAKEFGGLQESPQDVGQDLFGAEPLLFRW
jgi:hypothetical protein